MVSPYPVIRCSAWRTVRWGPAVRCQSRGRSKVRRWPVKYSVSWAVTAADFDSSAGRRVLGRPRMPSAGVSEKVVAATPSSVTPPGMGPLGRGAGTVTQVIRSGIELLHVFGSVVGLELG